MNDSGTQGKALPDGLVHRGRDGWLFLQGGSNFVATLYDREEGRLTDADLQPWRRAIRNRARWLGAMGIKHLFMVVPEKLTIYDHQTSVPLIDPELAPAVRLGEHIAQDDARRQVLDLVEPMRSERDKQLLFWRTDTHWSPAGCFLAYCLACERLGVRPDHTLLDRPYEEQTRIMDLGAWLDPMPFETVRAYNYLQNAQRVSINSVTRCLEDPLYQEQVHIGAQARFRNPHAPNPQRVLLIGDSYALPSGNRLTGMFAETFRQLDFVWSNSVDWLSVFRRRPDIVIIEIAERFLMLPPRDGRPWRLTEWRQERKAREIAQALAAKPSR